jgi:glycosyltransferase involved in cell wall biosynthesis
VVVTTEATQLEYSLMFPQHRHKISVVQQGVDVNCFSSIRLAPEFGRVAYVGSFYRDVREPFELIRAIAKLGGSATLHITGPSYPAAEMQVANTPGLNSVVTFHGFQSEDYCLEQISRASLLLFIGNRNSTQVPGKLFEYLATGLPVLEGV